MKILLILLLLVGNAWGEEVNCNWVCKEEVKSYEEPITAEFLIQSLAESGKICEVLGEHWWVEECLEVYSDYLGLPCQKQRVCKLCHKKQIWKEEWEDEKENQ